MRNLVDLNYDVLAYIISAITPYYLLPVLTTCRTLYTVGLPHLLNDVRIHTVHGLKSFHSAILRNPLWIRHIHSLVLSEGWVPYPYTDYTLAITALGADLIIRCNNLKTLVIDGPDALFRAFLNVSTEYCFSHLTRLVASDWRSGLSKPAVDWIRTIHAPVRHITLSTMLRMPTDRLFAALANFTETLESIVLHDAHIGAIEHLENSWPRVTSLSFTHCYLSLATLELCFPNAKELIVEIGSYAEEKEYIETRILNLGHSCMSWRELRVVKGDPVSLGMLVLSGCSTRHLSLYDFPGKSGADICTHVIEGIRSSSITVELDITETWVPESLSDMIGLSRMRLVLYALLPDSDLRHFLAHLPSTLARFKSLGVFELSIDGGHEVDTSLDQQAYAEHLFSAVTTLQSTTLQWEHTGWTSVVFVPHNTEDSTDALRANV